MLHRRLLVDDGLGVDEPLNDESFVIGKHQLLIANQLESRSWRAEQALHIFRPLIAFLAEDEEVSSDFAFDELQLKG